MTRILILAHAGLAQAFVQVSETILNRTDLPVDWIGAEWQQTREELLHLLKDYFATRDGPILVLTDLIGSTHVNLCSQFLKENQVEMVSGFNLPLLIKAILLVDDKPLSDLATMLTSYGKNYLSHVEPTSIATDNT